MKKFISYTQLVFNISYLSSDKLTYYENTAHIIRYWNNIKLAKEGFLSQQAFPITFRTEGSSLKCDKISLCPVSSLLSKYIGVFI